MRILFSYLYKISFLKQLYLRIVFYKINGYFPDFKKPQTFNEKVNYRKFNYRNVKYSILSDKIAVKKYVSAIVGEEYVIDTYKTSDTAEVNDVINVLNLYGSCLLKANHNSGPVYLINEGDSIEKIKYYCSNINNQLKIDFGEKNSEPWYSEIRPKVLIEKCLYDDENPYDLRDYKFHIFKQRNGEVKLVVHVDIDRNTNHSRSFFDEHFDWIALSSYAPNIYTKIKKPKNFEKMVEVAKKLAEPFSYVRVDLYNINGNIYFGEMTFAPGSGFSKFNSKKHDLWLGNLWQCDPED